MGTAVARNSWGRGLCVRWSGSLFAKTKPNRHVLWIATSLLVFPSFSYSGGGHAIGTATRLLGLIALAWLAAVAPSTRTAAVRIGGICAAACLFLGLLFVFHHIPTPKMPLEDRYTAFGDGKRRGRIDELGSLSARDARLSTTTAAREFEKVALWLGIGLMLLVIIRLPVEAVAPPQMDARPRSSGRAEGTLSQA